MGTRKRYIVDNVGIPECNRHTVGATQWITDRCRFPDRVTTHVPPDRHRTHECPSRWHLDVASRRCTRTKRCPRRLVAAIGCQGWRRREGRRRVRHRRHRSDGRRLGSDEELLKNENIENIDIFCALTNDDETNIMSAFLAKKLGAKKTIIIVNNYTYINILPKNFVDIALSPQRLTVSMVLQHLAKGDVPQDVIFKMQSGVEAI